MKKTLHVIGNILVWLLVIAAVAMMVFTIVSVNTFNRSDRTLFGYKAFIVMSDSMSAVKDDPAHEGYFDAGDLVLTKEVDPATLQPGDIIAYTSTSNESYGEVITHMIRSVTTDANGNPGFITYGTATDTDDANVVTYEQVIGKYAGHLAKVGKFFNFLKTTPGYIVCIFLPFLLLIIIQGIHSIRLFKKYRAEQMAEIEAQRAQGKEELQKQKDALEAERRKQEELMQKLLDMQAAMQEKQAAPDPVQQKAEAGEKPEDTTS